MIKLLISFFELMIIFISDYACHGPQIMLRIHIMVHSNIFGIVSDIYNSFHNSLYRRNGGIYQMVVHYDLFVYIWRLSDSILVSIPEHLDHRIRIYNEFLLTFSFMCSTFFVTATIGAVATTVLFFISFCPYIIVLIFDAQLNSLQNFLINLSFTTAFSHGWSHIMRMELQEVGLSFEAVFREGFRGEYGFALFMIVFDLILYMVIGFVHQRFKDGKSQVLHSTRSGYL